MPISRAALRSSAAARIDRPSVVRVTNRVSSPSRTIPATKLTTLTFGIVIVPIAMTPLSCSGLGKAISVGWPRQAGRQQRPVLEDLADGERGQQHRDVGRARIGR